MRNKKDSGLAKSRVFWLTDISDQSMCPSADNASKIGCDSLILSGLDHRPPLAVATAKDIAVPGMPALDGDEQRGGTAVIERQAKIQFSTGGGVCWLPTLFVFRARGNFWTSVG